MKLQGRKLFAFITTQINILLIYILTLFIAPEAIIAMSVTTLVLIVTNAAMYIGGNVWAGWTKSKHFQKDLKE